MVKIVKEVIENKSFKLYRLTIDNSNGYTKKFVVIGAVLCSPELPLFKIETLISPSGELALSKGNCLSLGHALSWA